MEAFAARCRRLADSAGFQKAVLALIAGNAVLMGVETSAGLMASFGSVFFAVNVGFQVVFVAEIAVRMLACWPRVHRFFAEGWNVFDLVVVAVSLLPIAGAFAGVARLARVLRVARLISTSPELRLIVGTMLRSIPSMGNVAALLGVLLYIYGVLGVSLFREIDPTAWGSLGAAFLTLFQIITLEGWVEIQERAMTAHPWAWTYFASFVVLAVFIVLNLFIAVVINNLEAAKAEERRRARSRAPRSPCRRAPGPASLTSCRGWWCWWCFSSWPAGSTTSRRQCWRRSSCSRCSSS
jgi:voltage-gated sodium channel